MASDNVVRRDEALDSLTNAELDVAIIGGGIVGAGIARDAALRGLRVGLLEQRDFASGTSSRSSRLLHGGLRYLAQGRVGLVREAGTEKNVVHSIAPHISAPLPFTFPTYKGRMWDDWALWKLAIGVRLYDLLSGIRDYRRSRSFGPRKVVELLPGIKQKGLTGAVHYFDGLTNDSRLVIDTIRSASAAGATVANHCRVQQVESAGGLWTCRVSDQLTDRTFEVTGKCVINATGPWAEQFKQSSVRLRLTKGVHLVVMGDRLPVPNAVVMTEGSRILFAIPWGSRVILGTTDTDYHDKPEEVGVTPEDTDYILDVVNSFFPEARLSGNDIISSWAGVRPLVASGNGGPSDISRSHVIRQPKPGWWDVAGGKLTTYRLMAEQTVDKVVKYLGYQGPACRTAALPLLPKEMTEGISAIVPPEPSRELVQHFLRNEWAVSLEDIMLRRTGWAYYYEDKEEVAARVAGWMTEEAE